jgi:hypothetical protein
MRLLCPALTFVVAGSPVMPGSYAGAVKRFQLKVYLARIAPGELPDSTFSG